MTILKLFFFHWLILHIGRVEDHVAITVLVHVETVLTNVWVWGGYRFISWRSQGCDTDHICPYGVVLSYHAKVWQSEERDHGGLGAQDDDYVSSSLDLVGTQTKVKFISLVLSHKLLLTCLEFVPLQDQMGVVNQFAAVLNGNHQVVVIVKHRLGDYHVKLDLSIANLPAPPVSDMNNLFLVVTDGLKYFQIDLACLLISCLGGQNLQVIECFLYQLVNIIIYSLACIELVCLSLSDVVEVLHRDFFL